MFIDSYNQNGKKAKDTSFLWSDLESETPHHQDSSLFLLA